MTTSDRPPPIADRWRMPLRIAVVFGAYAIYRSFGDRVAAGVFFAAGCVCLGFVLVDRLTLRPRDRSGLLDTGATLLGAGLVGLGLYLALR